MDAARPIHAAADRLAAWFDCGVTHQEGSSDGIALEDRAFSFNSEDLDWVAYRARDKNLPPPLRLAMAAIVAGERANAHAIAAQADLHLDHLMTRRCAGLPFSCPANWIA